jgi:hypothetical protein
MQTYAEQPSVSRLEMPDLAADFGTELLPVDRLIDDAIE